jgi:hypothetical protein
MISFVDMTFIIVGIITLGLIGYTIFNKED